MVLIFLGPFPLSRLLLPHILFIQSWFVCMLTLVKQNTFCPKTYVIKAYSITKIYAIKDGFIDIYVIGSLCHSTHATKYH
jgi:hypothetical protein